jgi:hypothetical protein
MSLYQRTFWGFHTMMGGVYVGLLVSCLVGWYDARDAIFRSGVAFCGFALLTYLAILSTSQLRLLRHESPHAIDRRS